MVRAASSGAGRRVSGGNCELQTKRGRGRGGIMDDFGWKEEKGKWRKRRKVKEEKEEKDRESGIEASMQSECRNITSYYSYWWC